MVVRGFLFIFCCLFMLSLAFTPAYADGQKNETQETKEKIPPTLFLSRNPADALTGAKYKSMVYDALEMNRNFDFGYFRSLYSNLEVYTPLPDQIQTEILTLAFTVRDLPPSKERSAAMEKYTNLLLQHLANMDVVATALALSREDARYGDPALYEWLYRGLLSNIMSTGTGARVVDAFRVITLGEEMAVLAKTRLKVLDSKPVKQGSTYYSMHRVLDPRTQQRYTIFINTSVPMRFLEKETQKNPKELSLRK